MSLARLNYVVSYFEDGLLCLKVVEDASVHLDADIESLVEDRRKSVEKELARVLASRESLLKFTILFEDRAKYHYVESLLEYLSKDSPSVCLVLALKQLLVLAKC